jgi:hypothetical protein
LIRARAGFALLPLAFLATAAAGAPQPEDTSGLEPYLKDRGRGIATSMFGTYIRKGEWIVYPFYEYTKTTGFEYAPEELGFTGSDEHFGTLTEHEWLLWVAYGLTDRLEVEVEGALHASATFEKAPDDLSAVPPRIEESGLGDVETQVRWRWSNETERRPELFSFFEVVFPFQRDNVILGTQDWEYELGFAAIKGHSWGTLTGRFALAYNSVDGSLESGEYAVEYLKKVSQRWQFLAAIEGDQTDEIEAIFQGQARLGKHVALKFNSGFGITKKAPDVAPEIGVMFRF